MMAKDFVEKCCDVKFLGKASIASNLDSIVVARHETYDWFSWPVNFSKK